MVFTIMAICRTRSLISQKYLVFSSIISEERWLTRSFSTDSVSTINQVVMVAPSNKNDEKHNLVQDQCQLSPKIYQNLFRKWGCSKAETSQILKRLRFIYKAKLDEVQTRLKLLKDLGFKSSDLVELVCFRPRFLSCKIDHCLDERVRYLEKLFGSRQTLQIAVLMNPSILTFDFKTKIKPTVELYKSMGITGNDLTSLLLSRSNVIRQTTLNAEKLEYIRRMGISKDSKMYKYVVKFIGIMRVESIREKIANLEEFGISEDDVLRLFGSNPVLLCLSVDKVKRNMSFVVTCLKQPANVVLGCPFLLCNNLEKMMKPRMVVAGKIDDMGLVPRIDRLNVIKALRMKEKRFVDAFINCHPPEIRKGLMECFLDAKQVQVLAKE